MIPVNGTAIDDLTTPISLKPFTAGVPWCLTVGADAPSGGTSNWGLRVQLEGWLIGGAFSSTAPTAPTGAGGSEPGPEATPQRPSR